MSSPCSQLVLKSTTSISLNERFSMMLQSQPVPLTDIRDTVPQQLTASVKNQRLAQQMGNRPSVLAALQNKLSVKQPQYKCSVKERLGWPVMRGRLRGMSRSWGRPRGRSILLRGALSPKFTNGNPIQQEHGPYINREQRAQSRGLRGGLRGKGRGMRFIGRGLAGKRRPDFHPLFTREELDAQLDEYMSMTKSRLDAQLDAYMAEVDSEDLLC